MNIIEASEHLTEAKSMRRRGWPFSFQRVYLFDNPNNLDKTLVQIHSVKDTTYTCPYVFTSEDIQAEDWETV